MTISYSETTCFSAYTLFDACMSHAYYCDWVAGPTRLLLSLLNVPLGMSGHIFLRSLHAHNQIRGLKQFRALALPH